MRNGVTFGLVLMAAVAAAGPAQACSCARHPTADGLMASHAVIFTGTVRTIETIAPGQRITTFVVTERFKGPAPGASVRVHHVSSSPAACGVTFERGRSYTLAAAMQRGALWTSQCSTWMFLPHVGLSKGLIARLRALRDRR